MDNLTMATIILGLIIGSVMLIATTFVYVRHQTFSLGGSILTAFGTLLLGLSIWQSVEFTVGPDGGISASFKKELDNLKRDVAVQIEGSNQAITEELSILRQEVQSGATSTLSDEALSNLQTREKVDALIDNGEYLEALKYDPKNTIALMRFIETSVSNGEYEIATNYYDELVKANKSGVGYSVYPDLILAFDKQGQKDSANKLLEALELRYKNDIAKGYGYYSRSQQLGWLERDLASKSALIENVETLNKLNQLRNEIKQTISVLKG